MASEDARTPPPVGLRIAAGPVELNADLTVPPDAVGVVLFAHGSGSSRHSARNQQVARGLQHAGLATVLMDLLTVEEDRRDQRTGELRFDIPLLAGRLTAAADQLADLAELARLPLVLFGASTGAAAALITAAERPDRVRGVVSRGGRPDLAGEHLARVRAPTLLIVGGHDPEVLRLNRAAAERMPGAVELVVVPGATHLFAEPGALESVTELAVQAVRRWLPDGPP
jgi:pimeloyl-ACP methyl ester carboxylesterase